MESVEERESYKLLELSEKSDSELDLPDFINIPRKKKIRRKVKRPRTITKSSSNCTCNLWVISVWITTLLLTTWIITLTWLAIIFHNELQRLDISFKGVVASSQGVPDALQKCHTISKNLQQNQTLILGQIADLKLQMENLSREVASVQLELNKIQEKLNNAPEYVNIPQQIKEVSGSVANLGSQIKDLTTTVTSLKDYKSKMESVTNNLQTNVTDLRQSVTHLQNVSQVPVAVNNKSNAEMEKIMKMVDELKSNVSTLNSTFSNKIQWLYDDQAKEYKTVDLLSETGQNMSARVTTLEGICGKCSSDEISLRTDVTDISKGLSALTTKVQGMSTQIPVLQSQYRQLNNSSADLLTKVRNLMEMTGPGSPSPITTPPDTPSTNQNEEKPKLVTPTSPLPATPSTAPNGKPPLLEMKEV